MLSDRCLSCQSVLSVWYCCQTVGWIKMKLGMQVGPGHIELDGDPAPSPKRDTVPQYSAHICCGQIAGWIKMPLGREVRLDPSDIVLDGDPAPLHKRGRAPPPQFSADLYCGQTAEWSKMPLGTEVDGHPTSFHVLLTN